MAFHFNGLSGTVVSITGGTGVMIPNSSQTLINVAGTGNDSVQNAYTITAGKTGYLMGLGCNSGASYYVEAYKNDGTTVVCRVETGATPTENPQFLPAAPIWVYTTGQVVKVKAKTNAVYNLIIIEV